jgi:hypothetical protein
MCDLFPAGFLLPNHVPSFSAALHGQVTAGLTLEQLIETARIMTLRHGGEFTEAKKEFYRQLFDRTRLERERAFQRADHGRSSPRLVSPACQAGFGH